MASGGIPRLLRAVSVKNRGASQSPLPSQAPVQSRPVLAPVVLLLGLAPTLSTPSPSDCPPILTCSCIPFTLALSSVYCFSQNKLIASGGIPRLLSVVNVNKQGVIPTSLSPAPVQSRPVPAPAVSLLGLPPTLSTPLTPQGSPLDVFLPSHALESPYLGTEQVNCLRRYTSPSQSCECEQTGVIPVSTNQMLRITKPELLG